MQVALRPVLESDGVAIHRLISDLDVVRYMAIPLSRTVEESCAFLRACLAELRFPTFAILAAEGEFIGMCGLGLQPGHEAAEIWYLVDPAHTGKGAGTAATRELLRIAFEERNLHRVWATCCPENPASARVLEKAGLRREGFQKRNLRIQGEWHDTYLYAMIEEEWRQL
jgi:RimJ/RimL family protein N-acetyltransferase